MRRKRGRGLNLLPNFQRENLTGSQFLEGVCWERMGGPFSSGVAVFT